MTLSFGYDAAELQLSTRREHQACLSYHEKRVGGLSRPGKMPWYAWSISALNCKVGAALRDIENSVCSKCYALKGRYAFPNVRKALDRRLQCYRQHPSKWAADMVIVLERKAKGQEQYFRWFDSGDVQGIEMIHAITWIAMKLPHIQFWLPTKESALFRRDSVKQLLELAPNLTVRISAPMIGQLNLLTDYPTSSVGTDWKMRCPAKDNNGKCGDCRACWNKEIKNVDYPEH